MAPRPKTLSANLRRPCSISPKIAAEVTILLTLAIRKRCSGLTGSLRSRSASPNDLAGVTDGKRERRYVVFLHEGMREPRHRGTLGRRRLWDAGGVRQRLGNRRAKRWGRS